MVYYLLKMVKLHKVNHNVENLPVLYRVTGTAFSPVSAALDQLKKRKKLMFNCTFSLILKDKRKVVMFSMFQR